MQEVVCFNCGRIVHISPDAELCSVCGENLRELLHPVYASKYFYDRAAQLAAGAEPLAALREIDRGLGYQPSSELRLLGAILAQRIGDFEQMRLHVAAVPVDDVLRNEAEWLLRSHQSRQRDQREATKSLPVGRDGARNALLPSAALSAEPVPPLLLPMRNGPLLATAAPKRRPARAVVYSTILLLALGLGAVLLDRSTGWLGIFSPTDISTAAREPAIVEPVSQPTVADPATLLPTVTPLPTIQLEPPPDVVQTTPEAVAASTPGDAVAVGAAQELDFKAYLTAQERPDLAELQVAAARQGAVIILDGFVASFSDRQALMTLAGEMAGVETVNAVDLFIRLPAIYVVQEGDTLWDITYRLYGDMNKMPTLVAANRAQLPSPEQLRVGMELQLPPFTP